jgi:uncharacterized small protein (DUF1192 family)
MGEPRPGSRPGRRVTLTEAAELLGMSRDAVRMRVRRGSLASEKGEDGRVYVFVEPDQVRDQEAAQHHADHAGHAYLQSEDRQHTYPLVEELRDRIEFLQRELERKDAILLNMTEAMKALNPPAPQEEPPLEPREARTAATEQPGRVGPQPAVESAQEGSQRAPWWRRIFGE